MLAPTLRARRTTHARALLMTVLPTLLVAALLAGCGGIGQPDPVGNSGVDRLEIPTAEPDPSDFVDRVDHPLLPLAPGSRWTYETTRDGEPVTTDAVTVAPGTSTVAGVAATVVETETTTVDGATTTQSAAFAQDRAGNVWQVAGPGWEAGVDGARAGLAMAATPRVGDGYEVQSAPGVAQDLARVAAVGKAVATTERVWTGVVEVEVVSPLRAGEVRRELYAPGTGLVLEEREDGDWRRELVSSDQD